MEETRPVGQLEVDQPARTMEMLAVWSRALRDPQLRDLPYKIETNEYGQLVLSPHKVRHSRAQTRLTDLLRDYLQRPGERAVEFAIATRGGVKVADVIWISDRRWRQIPEGAEASTVAPEICIEVLSGGNTEREIHDKRALYFAAGAEEFWTCDESGLMRFYDPSGERPSSHIVPTFPKTIYE